MSLTRQTITEVAEVMLPSKTVSLLPRMALTGLLKPLGNSAYVVRLQ